MNKKVDATLTYGKLHPRGLIRNVQLVFVGGCVVCMLAGVPYPRLFS
jgi:hypothetical protein